MNYEKRLSRLARTFGVTCAVHEEMLVCPRCEEREPYPEPLVAGMDDLIETIVSRVGDEAARAVVLRVPPPPVQDACPRCGSPRQCLSCQVAYGLELFRTIGLTPNERASLDRLRAMCRRLDAYPG